MTIAAAKPKKTAPKARQPAAQAEATPQLFTGQSTTGPGLPVKQKKADFVTDMFNLLETMHPAMAAERLELERAVRVHFGGSDHYISTRPDPGTQAARVLALFNGRNPRTVARQLGITPRRVYQILKQPGTKTNLPKE